MATWLGVLLLGAITWLLWRLMRIGEEIVLTLRRTRNEHPVPFHFEVVEHTRAEMAAANTEASALSAAMVEGFGGRQLSESERAEYQQMATRYEEVARRASAQNRLLDSMIEANAKVSHGLERCGEAQSRVMKAEAERLMAALTRA